MNFTLVNRIAFFLILVPIIGHNCAKSRLRNDLFVRFNFDCHLPECTSEDLDKSAVNLFQVVSNNSESSNQTNFIWSNIGGPPMVITTSSSQPSNLNIDWDVLLRGKTPSSPGKSGLYFTITQDEAIGMLVEKIIIFDDINNNGSFTPDKPSVEIDWAKIIWDLASRTTYRKDNFLKTIMRLKAGHKYLNGTISIKLAIPKDHRADRQKELPHLKLNDRSISMVIIVDGMQPPSSFKNARLAMTYVVVVQGPAGPIELVPNVESLISDEYTPGVFRIKSLQFKTKPNSASIEPHFDPVNSAEIYAQAGDVIMTSQSKPVASSEEKLGFLYWKEVAYTDRRKIISRTIDVSDHELAMPLDTLSNISQPFYQFFNHRPDAGPNPDYKLYRFEVIFGKTDTSYSLTNFTDFSLVIGLGAAPQEQMFSFLVKIIIFVCFCLPLIVMLVGLGYLLIRRLRRGSDTELLLSAES